jgi:hypothetical protein
MHPDIRRDLAGFRQFDHVHRQRIAAFFCSIGISARFKLPYRCIPRPADVGERNAGAAVKIRENKARGAAGQRRNDSDQTLMAWSRS